MASVFPSASAPYLAAFGGCAPTTWTRSPLAIWPHFASRPEPQEATPSPRARPDFVCYFWRPPFFSCFTLPASDGSFSGYGENTGHRPDLRWVRSEPDIAIAICYVAVPRPAIPLVRYSTTVRNASMRRVGTKNGHSFVSRFSEPMPGKYWDFRPTWHLQNLQNPHSPAANFEHTGTDGSVRTRMRGKLTARRATFAHGAPAAPDASTWPNDGHSAAGRCYCWGCPVSACSGEDCGCTCDRELVSSALKILISTRRFLARAARVWPSSTGFSWPSPIMWMR